ncbi:MAG: signal recognition particle-docking protein FtsY [Desulfobulbaceae bacterium]|nr:signal recognition particle-docking protein FtsY [Desulfobulbaceae bacterium]
MLGWFKKKFNKKEEEPAAVTEAEIVEETVSEQVSPEAVVTEFDTISPSVTVEKTVEVAVPVTEAENRAEVPAEVEPMEEEAIETPVADTEELVAEIQDQPIKDTPREKPVSRSMFGRLQERLGKTRDSFVHRLDSLFLGKKEIDQELLDDLEELLITADLGVGTTHELLDSARAKVKRNELSDPLALKQVLRDNILDYLQKSDQPAELVMPASGPFVIMVVGVNGVGKTTTIGKIGAKFVRSGQSVLLVAGDTFRAAAIDQLKIWGNRIGVEVVAQSPGTDPSSVVFDGIGYGVAHDFDVIIIDTAGRLHTSVNLMEELKKINRVIGKKHAGAPHEVMLVLDATTGQNGISQAKLFNEAVGITGLTLTKLDGTAKGGIVVNVCRELKIPVRFIGIGEQIDDLRDFDPQEFVDALFEQESA